MKNILRRVDNEIYAHGVMALHLIVNALVIGIGIADSVIKQYISPLLWLGAAETPLTLSSVVNAIHRSGQLLNPKKVHAKYENH